MSDSKSILPAVLMVGGALISCGIGMLALSKLRSYSNRGQQPVHSNCTATVNNNSITSDKNGGEHTFSIPTNRDTCLSYSKENYNWHQTLEEVYISFSVDAHVKSKNVQCTFNTNSLKILVDGVIYMKGALYRPITPDECSWELDGNGNSRKLTVTLTKAPLNAIHWESLIYPDEDTDDATLYTT